MPIEIDWKSSQNSMKGQWNSIGNPVEISMVYQWKLIGNQEELPMETQ